MTTGYALEKFFSPESVAVIGATNRERSVGRTVLMNLRNGSFPGKVYAVNPNHPEVLGLPSYPAIAAVPGPVDLALVVTPAATVPGVIGECVDAGVKAAIVITAGFKEHGEAGAELERQIYAHLQRGTMRLVGPNCLGMMNPALGLNATFAHEIARPGSVAFLSQSGALLTAILDWSLREQVGFSAIVSTGSMLDVGWGDLINFFGEDPQTRSILLYMESIGEARSFLSAAREVALRKPIIVIKAGRSEAASRAAASHTGALTGSDEVFDAAMRRCGVLRVQNISDLFHMAEVLDKQPRPSGPRLTVVTNAGGPGVLATDALIANGGELATLSRESLAALDQFLPPHWSHGNPIDILGDAAPEHYARAVEIARKDPGSDGLLVILAPQGMTDPGKVAEGLAPYAKGSGKPLLASWMGGALVAPGQEMLNRSGIPTFAYPDTAARAFVHMWRYSKNLRALYETPVLGEDHVVEAESRTQPGTQPRTEPHTQPRAEPRTEIEKLLEQVRGAGRTLLTEVESKRVLALAGVPTVETDVAGSADEAVARATQLGYPVVLKIYSQTITHKTDVGGVKLNLQSADAVRHAYRAIESSVLEKVGPEGFLGVTVQPMVKLYGYELILGSSIDPQFGPVLLFGSGGQLVEVYRDRALALPPLNTTLAQRLMEQTRIFAALQGTRGRPAIDLQELAVLLTRFSKLVVEHPWIQEVDINPLLASPERLLALDARIILHPPATLPQELPRPAIRPYPVQYVAPWTMKDGTPVVIRPIRPEDEPQMAQFHATLSERTVYLRYFHMTKLSTRIDHERLIQRCFSDYDREMALVVDRADPATGRQEIIGIARISKSRTGREAEVGVLVADRYQHTGIGTELLRRLIRIARDENLERIEAHILAENSDMRALASRFGFKNRPGADLDSMTAVLELL